jgi:hypothetical protein
LLRSEKNKIAAKESNNQLIPIYKEQIKKLVEQNKQIDNALSDKRFSKDNPSKFLKLEHLKSKNEMMMGELVEKINNLEKQKEEVSEEDKVAISELYAEQLHQKLFRYKIEQKIDLNSR